MTGLQWRARPRKSLPLDGGGPAKTLLAVVGRFPVFGTWPMRLFGIPAVWAARAIKRMGSRIPRRNRSTCRVLSPASR
jgi:hypothetical protein